MDNLANRSLFSTGAMDALAPAILGKSITVSTF